MSDRKLNILPAAKKLYAKLLKSNGKQTGAMVEALEIARRTAEIEQTTEDWAARHALPLGDGADLLNDAREVFAYLAKEFGQKRAVHVLVALEVEHSWAKRSEEMLEWRKRRGFFVHHAAIELGISVEDITAIEGGIFKAGPDFMHRVLPILTRVRKELQ